MINDIKRVMHQPSLSAAGGHGRGRSPGATCGEGSETAADGSPPAGRTPPEGTPSTQDQDYEAAAARRSRKIGV